MPERKRTTRIGVYPRILRLPFFLGLIFLAITAFSVLAGIMNLNIYIPIISIAISFLILRWITRKYGDFYIQNMKITRYGTLKTNTFITHLEWNMIKNKISN